MSERRPLLFLACPRSGTGYVSRYMRWLGYDVGHEKMGADGMSCWAWVVEDECPWQPHRRPPNFLDRFYVYHVTRDPVLCVPSLMTIGDEAWNWFRRHVPIRTQVTLADAFSLWLEWNRRIEAIGPIGVFDVSEFKPGGECPFPRIAKKLCAPPPTNYNAKTHPTYTWEQLSKELRKA